ncbi:MAG: DUF1223 domain-containing protein [Pseudochelatococcus sp.]|uniref:DUF1223 domain-containing protein n=1 Tax=Pseudochelatococcus sp. TaxID=2020869 RepID=UPI003D8A08C7
MKRLSIEWNRFSVGMVIGGFLGACLLLPLAAAAQQNAPAGQTRAVVELFTSQGCASCPPADLLMCDYARDASVVVLTLPVTCWDYLGWRDTLANEKFTKRQRIYAKLRGARRIYTPQAIVNGVAHVIGSDDTALRKALHTQSVASRAPLPIAVLIARKDGGFRVTITPTAEVSREPATVVLAPFYRERTVRVEGGENNGRELHYFNVVRDLVPLASLAAQPHQTLDLPTPDAMPDGTDGFAILVQSGDPAAPGRMLGAATFTAPE